MTYTPIPKGTQDWDVPLNAALVDLDARETLDAANIATNSAQISANSSAISTNSSNITSLQTLTGTLGWTAGDHNLKAWSSDPANLEGGTAVTTTNGTVYLIKVLLRSATSVTNIIINAHAAGTGLTASQNFAGLYDVSGNRIAITADQSAVWNTIGTKTMPLVGGPFALSAGFYYVAILSNGSSATFAPAKTMGGNFASAINVGLTAATGRFVTGPTAQTSLPATITMGANVTDTQSAKWVALS